MTLRRTLAALAVLCAAAPLVASDDPYPSTYQALPSEPVLIVNATLLTGTGTRIDSGSLLLAEGRVEAISEGPISSRSNRADLDSARVVGDRCAFLRDEPLELLDSELCDQELDARAVAVLLLAEACEHARDGLHFG